MKRDARIGLAVVLVLGLMVTLLVGRAIYNSNSDMAEMDGSLPALEGAAQHSDSTDSGSLSVPAPAALQNDSGLASVNSGNTGSAAAPGDALNRFVEDQSRNIGGGPVNPVPPAHAPIGRAPVIEENATIVPLPPAPPIGGDRTVAPAPRVTPINADDLDHESPHPVAHNTETIPADGYGYTVIAGDNIWKISSKIYGDGKFTQKIVDANKDVNVQKLKPGMVLKVPQLPNKTVLMKLPSFADAKAGRGAAPAAEPSQFNQPVPASRGVAAPSDRAGGISTSTETALPGVEHKHTVAAGETLGVIAQKYYGASGPKSVGRILAANKSVDPAKLKIGQELVIPAK
jgi:nucleoid-associated protein YgaU